MAHPITVDGSNLSTARRDELAKLLFDEGAADSLPVAEMVARVGSPSIECPTAAEAERLADVLEGEGFSVDRSAVGPAEPPSTAEPAQPVAVAQDDAPASSVRQLPSETPADTAAQSLSTTGARAKSSSKALPAVLGLFAVAMTAVLVVALNGPASDQATSSVEADALALEMEASVPEMMMADTTVFESATSSDDAFQAYGFSPAQGVNWNLFTPASQTRYAASPSGQPVPVRDVPSGQNGAAVNEVAYGASVTTDGCLPQWAEDGGQWCRLASGDGWIYTRFLSASAPTAPAAPGGLRTVSNDRGETWVATTLGGQAYRTPRSLSPGTSVYNLGSRSLAGRTVVEFEARDGRWTTAYFWDVRGGELHYVSTENATGLVNTSDGPASARILAAAYGSVPQRTYVRRSEREAAAPRAPSRTSGRAHTFYVLLGSYEPYDTDGLRRREVLARQTGYSFQTGPAENFGIRTRDLVVIAVGPFSTRASADDARARILPTVSDAFVVSLRN